MFAIQDVDTGLFLSSINPFCWAGREIENGILINCVIVESNFELNFEDLNVKIVPVKEKIAYEKY